MKQVRDGYKQTKVGIIPQDWGVVKIGNVLKIGSGKDYKHLEDGDIPVYGTGGYMLSVNKYLYNGESVCIGRKGTINKPMLLNEKFWTVDTLFYTHCFRNSIPKYIYLVFLRINWKKYNEGSSIPSLSKTTIESILIALPPLNEQEIIAEILTTWDNAIIKQQELIKSKEEQKKGLMQKLLSGEVRFDGFSDEWKFIKLGDLLDYEQPTQYLVSDTSYSDEYKTPVLTAGKTFILGYTNETDGIFTRDLPVIIFDDFTTANKFVDFPFKAKSSAMKILKPKNKSVNIKLIYEIMQMINFVADDHKRYWISEYQELDIKLPSKEEQKKIAEVLSLADEEIKNLKNELKEQKQQKKALMQKLLTGQVRVKV